MYVCVFQPWFLVTVCHSMLVLSSVFLVTLCHSMLRFIFSVSRRILINNLGSARFKSLTGLWPSWLTYLLILPSPCRSVPWHYLRLCYFNYFSFVCSLLCILLSVYGYSSRCSTYLTLRRLTSYIYIYGTPILDVSRSHTTTQHSR